MAQTLDGFIDECIAVIRDVSGIETVPDNPVGQVGASPFSTVYTTAGRDRGGPGDKRTSLDDVTIAVMVHQSAMRRWIDTLLPMRESVPQALYDRLNGVEGFTHSQNFNEINVFFGPIDWGEVQMFGWLFTIEQVHRIN